MKRSSRESLPTCARFASTTGPPRCTATASRNTSCAAGAPTSRTSIERLGLPRQSSGKMLNEATLREYLRDRLPGAHRSLSIEPLQGGQSNPTFRLRFGSKSYVLRKRPEGTLLPSAHAVDREYRVISALADSGVPVPRTYCYCDDVRVIGTPFFVMDYVDGRVFRDPALPELDVHERAALWDD